MNIRNITWKELHNIISNMNISKIPADWTYTHDKTKWNNAKEKAKIKNLDSKIHNKNSYFENN